MNSDRTDEIKMLLTRFYDGATTEEEESRLRNLFSEADLPECLAADRAFFMALSDDAGVEVPDGLDCRLSAAVEAQAMKEKESNRRKSRVRIISMRRIAGVAASVTVVLAIGFGLNHYNGCTADSEMADTFTDPNDAYKVTEKALMIFANAVNKGVDGVEKTEDVSGRALELLYK